MGKELVGVTVEERERAIAVLSEHFTRGDLDVDEFDRRLSLAHAANVPSELARLSDGLPPLASRELTAPPARALVPEAQIPAKARVFAMMGGVQRSGAWRVPRRLNVTVAMGGVELDFREARLPAGVIELHVTALMGGVHIIVPPNLAIEAHGHAVMGGFEAVDRAPAAPEPTLPLVRIHGLALMGGVSVETRLPGESERDARKRRRRAQRA